MANLFDYIVWRGDLDFAAAPPNEVDFAALSQIVLLDLGGCFRKRGRTPLREVYRRYVESGREESKRGFIIPVEIGALFGKMAESDRFGGLLLSAYEEDIDVRLEVQFSALVADAEEAGERFVFYSGTDDTIIGWKENLNLIYRTPTAAQLLSVSYLDEAARGAKKLRVFGHSKGGHLAVYSAMNCKPSTAAKIAEVVSLDGPGMSGPLAKKEEEPSPKITVRTLTADSGDKKEILSHSVTVNAAPPKRKSARDKAAAREEEMIKKTRTVLPCSSVIGRLLSHAERFDIVKSTGEGLMQHDCFTWEVSGPAFVRAEGFDELSDGVDEAMRKIISELTDEERERFVEGLFSILYSPSCTTLTDLSGRGKEVVQAYFKADRHTRSAINRTIMLFIKDKNIRRCFISSSRSFRKKNKEDEPLPKLPEPEPESSEPNSSPETN